MVENKYIGKLINQKECNMSGNHGQELHHGLEERRIN